MKSLISSYAMAASGFIIPPLAGLHRFYLGRPVSGLLYCMTGGFLGLGTLFDMLFLIPQMVDEENRRLLGENPLDALPPGSFVQPAMVNPFMGIMDPDPMKVETAEKQILKAAEKRDGELTIQMMALDTDLSLDEAKTVAEHMRKSGYCHLDIAEDGAEVYKFIGLTKKPLVLD